MTAKFAQLPSGQKIAALVHNVRTLHAELADARRLVQAASAHVAKVERAVQSNAAALEELTGQVIDMPQRKAAVESPGDLAGAVLLGQAAVAQWVAEGVLVPSSTFAGAWGITRQALDQAVERGELFSIKHGNKRYYPQPLLGLDRRSVAHVCKALGRADGAEKFIFWQRKHGGLSGRTAVLAVAVGQSERVAQLARDWAEEHGLADAVAPA
jgi:hypothetical protein